MLSNDSAFPSQDSTGAAVLKLLAATDGVLRAVWGAGWPGQEGMLCSQGGPNVNPKVWPLLCGGRVIQNRPGMAPGPGCGASTHLVLSPAVPGALGHLLSLDMSRQL